MLTIISPNILNPIRTIYIHLTEKHYENLVEVLTNNAIDNAANTSSSNSTLSLPPSSSGSFPNLFNQGYTRWTEEPETYNSKGDIAD